MLETRPDDFLVPDPDEAGNSMNRGPFVLMHMPKRGGQTRVAVLEPTTAVDIVDTPTDAPSTGTLAASEATPEPNEVTGLERLSLLGGKPEPQTMSVRELKEELTAGGVTTVGMLYKEDLTVAVKTLRETTPSSPPVTSPANLAAAAGAAAGASSEATCSHCGKKGVALKTCSRCKQASFSPMAPTPKP